MADLLQGTDVPDFREVGHVLASLSGIDLATVRRSTVQRWEARGLALLAMAQGDLAEAERVMANFNNGRNRGMKTGAALARKE
ncbi:TPA: hypothetical protein UOA81_000846 [Stenotrophomonas maltophilia]|uniref:hypothetical protein n=1 Tax=Stenotrophomonas indicatrix TaxID=2045451 RepID=UPI000B43076B|nr:hypothetical protein [Stenotrophomonas maltophilia]